MTPRPRWGGSAPRPDRPSGGPTRRPDRECPYELQDFTLYHTLRFRYAPPKVAFISYCAWHDPEAGAGPDISPDRRHQYDIGRIKSTLRIFLD
jgi:NAD+ synthase (glutamine-hydrolysing)